MSMFSRLLISIVCLLPLVSLAAHDEEVRHFYPHEDKIETTFSGFVYSRVFQDHLWHEDMQKGAFNVDVNYKDVKFSAQISTDTKPIRRATVAYSCQVVDGLEVHAAHGVLPRLDSFFNNVTDNPGTAGMAMLPFAGYNYRMQTGTFTLLKGEELKLVATIPNKALVTLRGTYGEMYIDDEKDLNEYLFNRYVPNLSINVPRKSHDVSIHYESEHLHFFRSYTHYVADTTALATDPMAMFVSNRSKDLSYEVNKIGAKIHNELGWLQWEQVDGNTLAKNTSGVITYDSVASDQYYVLGAYLNDYYQAYVGRSSGRSYVKNTTTKRVATDLFAGVTRETGKYAVSIEYHRGEGSPWMKYGATTNPKWRSWVAAGTYRF